MAITIETQPQNFSTVYNPMVVVASSTNTTEADFSYIFEVCDSGGTTLRTLRIPAEPNYSYGVCDVARVLESYLGTDFFKNVGTADTQDCDNSFYSFEIEIGEEYDVSGTLTQFLDLASFTAVCINGSLTYLDFTNYDYTDYVLDGATKRALTDDIDKIVNFDQEGYLHFMNDTAPAQFVIKTYEEDGTLQQTATITNAATSDVAMVASAPTTLNAATLATGSQPLIASDTSYYEIYADNTGVLSRTYTYKIKSDCGDGAVIHFLNTLGGFDSFPFITIKDSYDIKREEYKQNPDRLQSNGAYTFTTYDRERVQYHTKRTKRSRLNTDYLSDEQSIWLRQLVESPEVYLYDGANYYSVIITANNYEVKEYDYNDMFQLEIEVEYSVEGYRQRY